MSAPAPSPSVDHFPLKTSHLDIWVVALIGMGGAAMLMGNFAILCNRTYTPIRSKSVPLTLLSSLGGLMWIIAVLVANDHFERKEGSGLNVCILWTYWLQVCGFALWLNCLTLRLIGLYRIFICKRGTRNFYPLLIPLLLPAIAFCIAASSTHELKQMSSSAGFLQMQAQLRDARAEVQEHQDKIRQLEEEVKTLEFEYAAMQQAASSNSSPNGRDSISKDFC